MAVKEYFLPHSLSEATTLLAQYGSDLLVLAGGTLAMPQLNEGELLPRQVMGLRRAGLNYLNSNGNLVIGAMTPLSQLLSLAHLPLLQSAAQSAAAWASRNMATVGGNLFAPPPYGDVATALLALEAQVKLAGNGTERLLPLADFFTGVDRRALQPDELLVELQLSPPAGQTAYLKFGRKQFNTPAVVTVAAHLTLAQGVVTAARLALNGAGPYPLRAVQAEQVLAGQPLNAETIEAAAAAARAESDPPTDAVASAWYRRKMVGVYVSRILAQIAGQEP